MSVNANGTLRPTRWRASMTIESLNIGPQNVP